jgi:hypothetical protein
MLILNIVCVIYVKLCLASKALAASAGTTSGTPKFALVTADGNPGITSSSSSGGAQSS